MSESEDEKPVDNRQRPDCGLRSCLSVVFGFGLAYGIILMHGLDGDCTEVNVSQAKYHYRAHRALSHATGFTVTWRF